MSILKRAATPQVGVGCFSEIACSISPPDPVPSMASLFADPVHSDNPVEMITLSKHIIPIILGCLLLSLTALTSIQVEASLLLTIPPEEEDSPATAVYRKAMRALETGDIASAESHFLTRLKQDSDHVGSLVGLALVADARNQHDIAEKYFHGALIAAPDNAVVRGVWGRYLTQQNRLEEAETELRLAISLDPGVPDYRLDLGELYLSHMGEYHAAVTEFSEAARLDPDNAGAHLQLGGVLDILGQTERARMAFTEAGRLEPSNPLPFHALGKLYAKQKDHKGALGAFQNAIDAEPGFYQSHVARGDVFLTLGDVERALSAYDGALQVKPDLPQIHLKIGIVHKQAGRYARAEEAFRESIRISPQNPVAYNNLSWMLAEQGTRLDEALKWAETAVDQSGGSAPFLDTLGWVLYLRGDLAQAVVHLRNASVLLPKSAEVHYHLGVVLMEFGKSGDAISAFKTALDLQPAFRHAEDARRRLGQLVE